MKTRVSLPEDTFDRESRRAMDLGMSRSEFFARAADRYLDELDADSVAKQIDMALADLAHDNESQNRATEVGRQVLAEGICEW